MLDAKVVSGKFRKDRDRQKPGSPKVRGMPTCPDWMCESGRRYWEIIGPGLDESNLSSPLDLASLAAHCDTVGRFFDVCRELSSIDSLVAETPNSLQIQSALFTIRNKLWDQIYSSAKQFGLTPVSSKKLFQTIDPNSGLGGFADL